MKRAELFQEIEKIEDLDKDFPKILSNLHYTHFYLMDRYKKILAAYDLTLPQSNVLGIVFHFHPRPVTLEEIKEMILEPGSDVSRIVGRLAEKEFIEKVVNPDNRRKVSIKVTAKGIKVLNKFSGDKSFKRFAYVITKSEAKIFSDILSKLRNA